MDKKAKLKRTKAIKIRVNESEFERLQSLKTKTHLANWMRSFCLSAPTSPHSPPPKIDPFLLRQIAGIGNNLNQIARRINSGEWGAIDQIQIISALARIERELTELRELHRDR